MILKILFALFFYLFGVFSNEIDTWHKRDSQEECFQIGSCRNSFQITGERMLDEFACLQFCKSEPECLWLTYNPSTSYCQLFSECLTLDSEFCQDCLTSQTECVPDPPACWLQGECSGIVDHAVLAQIPLDCLQICNATIGCLWWTFDATVNECVLFKTCVEVDESCQDCVTGERRCIDDVTSTTTPASSSTIVPPKGFTKLLVALGCDLPHGARPKTVEVINLDETNPNLSCQDLADLPSHLCAATGQLFQGKTPIICGGAYGDAFNFNISSDCHSFENGVWNKIASLNEAKYHSSSATFLKEENEVFLITGGRSRNESLSTVESFDGQTWSQGSLSHLPESAYNHCLVKINNSMLFQAQTNRKTYFFDTDENKWFPGPDLNELSFSQSCRVMNWINPNSENEEKVVVVAGGGTNFVDPVSVVELLFLNDLQTGWILGPSLLDELYIFESQMIEYQNSVILVGGGYRAQGGKNLYQLSNPHGKWTKMRQTLNVGRTEHVAFLIPDELTDCQ